MQNATLIVDLSSLAHHVGDLDGNVRRAGIHLLSLVKVLEARNYKITRVLVAVATVPVVTGHDSDVKLAQQITNQNLNWINEQRLAIGQSWEFSVLDGGHDGNREIGVDDLVVAAALAEAKRVSEQNLETSEVVLVVTHDSDMDHIPAYAWPTKVRLVGGFDSETRRRLSRAGASFDSLYDYELRNCGLDSPWLIEIAEDDASRVYDLIPAQLDNPSIGGSVAVIDAYGIACSAACALGVSRLPNVESLRALLEATGFERTSALLVTIPDIRRALPSDDQFIHLRNLAWAARDRELDALANEIRDDSDDGTQVRRGLLNPQYLSSNLAARLDRSGPTRAVKRVATQLTADLVSLCLSDHCTQVILITDSPHVVWVQAMVARILGADHPPIIRLGIFAAPVVLVDDRGEHCLPDAAFRIINEDEIARVTRTRSLVGRDLRQRVQSLIRSEDLASKTWKVVAFDPEIDGLRVRMVDDPKFEMLLADSLTLGLKPGQDIDGKSVGLELHFQPDSPTMFPVPSCTNGAHGEAVRSYADVEVLERDGTHVHFDVDGDRIPDGSVELGHDLRPIGDTSRALLGKLGKKNSEWYFVSTDDTSKANRATVVEIVRHDGEETYARARGTGDAPVGRVLPPPNSPFPRISHGDFVWAIDVSASDDEPVWVSLSSPIEMHYGWIETPK